MKKNFLVKLIATSVSFLAIGSAAFALQGFARECALGNWCPLTNPGDIASYKVFPNLGNNYACTLYAGSKSGKRMVSVSITGIDGYSLNPVTLSAKEGTTVSKTIKGSFPGSRGLIAITRNADAVENPTDVRIMCTN
jgi:hypothetical protein